MNLAFFAVNMISISLMLRYHRLTVTYEIADEGASKVAGEDGPYTVVESKEKEA